MKTLLYLCWAMILAVTLSSCATDPSGEGASVPPAAVAPGSDYRKSKADVVVLNFFDMYCPHCQKDAKYVNELYDMTQRSGLGKKVDFYAIGWNNTTLEAEMYRKRYQVQYPVTPDKQRLISARFGKVRTPLIVVMKKEQGQWHETYRTHKIKGKVKDVFSKIQQ